MQTSKGLKAVGYWLLMLAAMVVSGAFREFVLVPHVGERAGQLVSALMGIAIISFVSYLYVRSLARPAARPLLAVAVIWLGMTVGFEFLFGHYVAGHSWGALLSNYDVGEGRLWPLVLASVAVAPMLWGAHFRRREAVH